MKTIQELQEELSHAVRSAEDITTAAEKRNELPNGSEQKAIDDHLKRAGELREEIANIRKAEERVAAVKKAKAELTVPDSRKTQSDNPNPNPSDGGADRIEIPSRVYRYGSLKAFRGKNADFNAYKSGQMLLASVANNYRAQRWCQNNGVEYRAMSEGSNTGGGAIVPDEMSQAIIDLREQYGVFRQNCRVTPMGRDTLTLARRTGGLTAYFTSEGAAITASDKTYDQVLLVAKKIGVLSYWSTELDEDAVISIADDLAQEMAYAFALKEDQCGFNGDGTSTYGGITGVTQKIAGLAGAVTAGTNHDTFAEIDVNDLASVMGKLPAYARMGAKWFCSQVAYDVIFSRLAANAGGNTIQSISGAFQPSYLGYPIVVSQVLPTATTSLTGSAMLLFGNLRMAADLGERRGISVKRSDEIKFVEDQIAIKGTERIDINVHDVGDASTAGPIVALIGA